MKVRDYKSLGCAETRRLDILDFPFISLDDQRPQARPLKCQKQPLKCASFAT